GADVGGGAAVAVVAGRAFGDGHGDALVEDADRRGGTRDNRAAHVAVGRVFVRAAGARALIDGTGIVVGARGVVGGDRAADRWVADVAGAADVVVAADRAADADAADAHVFHRAGAAVAAAPFARGVAAKSGVGIEAVAGAVVVVVAARW